MHGADVYYIAGFPLKGHQNQRYDESDKQMSKLMMQMWANFASNG
jgi:carboxylesterase type B